MSSLNDKWDLWYHNINDSDWSINGYKNLLTIETLDDYFLPYTYLKQNTIENSMLFIMRKNIKPMWEDESNKDGGCISFKYPKNNIYNVWNDFAMNLLGENFLNIEDKKMINGISLSPKKNFCIIKIWIKNKEQDKKIFNKLEGINYEGAIFKSHQ